MMIKKHIGKILMGIIFFLAFFILFKTQESKNERLLFIHDDLIQQRNELAETVTSQEEKIKELEKGFTYLDDLTEEEREKYQSFLETKKISDLILSPEKTLLVYLHAVSNGHIEAIHALTQTTESLAEFSTRYQGSEQSYQDMESVMTYRYYDFVEIHEDKNTTDTNVNVEIAISQAANKWVTLYHLIKDGNNWKLDLSTI